MRRTHLHGAVSLEHLLVAISADLIVADSVNNSTEDDWDEDHMLRQLCCYPLLNL